MQKQNFTASNPNFAARIIIFALAILAAIGIKFPTSPEVLGTQIESTISTTGLVSVLGIMLISVLMPVYNYVKTKPKQKITWATFFGSSNFVIYLITFLIGLMVMVGIAVPDGTAEQIAGFIFARDWGALIGIIFANILDPLIRYAKDKKKDQPS